MLNDCDHETACGAACAATTRRPVPQPEWPRPPSTPATRASLPALGQIADQAGDVVGDGRPTGLPPWTAA
jgi:hypothetical protein